MSEVVFDSDRLAYASFPYFASVVGDHVISEFELRPGEKFVWKPFHADWCDKMQVRNRYAVVAFRASMKSTILKLFLMWELYRLLRGRESPEYWNMYLSYNDDLAAMHTTKLKDYLLATHLFRKCENLSPSASIIKLRLPNGKLFKVEPKSIKSNLRGPHPDSVLFDDILGDVAKNMKLDAGEVLKINMLFLSQVYYLPRTGSGKLIGAGTPQMYGDLFDILEKEAQRKDLPMEMQWEVNRLPVEDSQGHSVMPECYPDKFLEVLRGTEGTEVRLAYNREMLVKPARETLKSWIPRKLIQKAVVDSPEEHEPKVTVGGLDLGKRKHPSHLVFFEPHGRVLRQIHSQWFDRKDYTEVLATTCLLCEQYNCNLCYADNTRADLDSFFEQGVFRYHDVFNPEHMRIYDMNPAIEGVPISLQQKWKIAQYLYNAFEQEKITLLPDARQERQLANVDGNLQAPETTEGHGEPFTTIGLAVKAAFELGYLVDSRVTHKRQLSKEERECRMFEFFGKCDSPSGKYDSVAGIPRTN